MAGPHWRFGTFSFLLYSQRFIKGQVAVARQKSICSSFYSEKYSRSSELLSGLKIAVCNKLEMSRVHWTTHCTLTLA